METAVPAGQQVFLVTKSRIQTQQTFRRLYAEAEVKAETEDDAIAIAQAQEACLNWKLIEGFWNDLPETREDDDELEYEVEAVQAAATPATEEVSSFDDETQALLAKLAIGNSGIKSIAW